VKLPDVNLPIYAIDERSPKHRPAKLWLEQALSGTEEVGFAWLTLIGFVRISTNPAALERPFSVAEAFEYVDEWLDRPVATVIHPTERHAGLMRDLLESVGSAAGNLTSDAHLAALAIEHGAELCSHDNDFARFEGLRWHDPLA
jgi:toxin-antitoxin system PIN domain toxin